jgi:uncharacterized membrane protein
MHIYGTEANEHQEDRRYSGVVTGVKRRERSGWWLVLFGFAAGFLGLLAIQVSAVLL